MLFLCAWAEMHSSESDHFYGPDDGITTQYILVKWPPVTLADTLATL